MKPNFEMEDELEQAKAERDYWKSLFTSLIENAPKPTLAVDHNENITHWNDAAVDFTGVSQSEAIGTPADAFADVDDGEELVAAPAVRQQSSVVSDPRTGTDESGEMWTTIDVGIPLENQHGEVVGAFEYVAVVTAVLNSD